MSISWMTKIWQSGPERTTDRLVLLCLADIAGDEGKAWPSISTIAQKCALTERGVQKIIRRLEDENWIEIETGNGRRGCNNYQLKNPEPRSPRTVFTLNSGAETPNKSAQNPEPRSPEPSRTIKEPSLPPKVPHEWETEFDHFWVFYPHKVGKGAARIAFPKALKRASFTEIMFGLDRYINKTDDRPWCNPSTWLNQDRWEDEPALPPPKPSVEQNNPRLAANQRFIERHEENEQRSSQSPELVKLIDATARQLEH